MRIDWRRQNLTLKEKMYKEFVRYMFRWGNRQVPNLFTRGMTVYMLKNNSKTDLVGAEIGVANGLNAYVMLSTLPIKRLYCIDPYVVDTADSSSVKAHRVLSRFKDRVVFLKDFSNVAVDKIADGELDFIYFDGGHDFATVKKDIYLYYSKVKVGGIIGGDDYCLPEVRKAVDEFVKENGCHLITDPGDYDWWMKKSRINYKKLVL